MAEMEKRAKKTRTREQEERNYRMLYRVAHPVLGRLLYPYQTLHQERIPEGACIICPNHNCWIDPPMACFAMTNRYHIYIMAKQELMELPVLGRIFDSIGTFGVDRGNSDVGAIKRALRVLKDGQKLLMFPEGTRVAEGEGDAKTGAIMLAMKTGVPLLPVYMTRHKKPFHKSTVVIGEPYTVKPAGRRATPAEYEEQAQILLDRIYALEEEAK